jgi:hypothetical protein
MSALAGSDSLSTTSVVKDACLATNVRKCEEIIRGDLSCRTRCDFSVFGDALYIPNGPGNIIALGVEEGLELSKDE